MYFNYVVLSDVKTEREGLATTDRVQASTQATSVEIKDLTTGAPNVVAIGKSTNALTPSFHNAATNGESDSTTKKFIRATPLVTEESTTSIHGITDQSMLQFCPYGGWTDWIDMNDPGSKFTGGDQELLSKAMEFHFICNEPTYIECREVGSKHYYNEIEGQVKVTCHPDIGLLCFNKDQKNRQCIDYEVRFYCPCPDQNVIPPAEDKVVLCKGNEWTQWIDMSNPDTIGLRGDYELLGEMIEPYGVCEDPTDIQCRVVGSHHFYDEGHAQRKIVCEPHIGFLCFNYYQLSKQCMDYEVRFLCPCAFPVTGMPGLTTDVRLPDETKLLTKSKDLPVHDVTLTSEPVILTAKPMDEKTIGATVSHAETTVKDIPLTSVPVLSTTKSVKPPMNSSNPPTGRKTETESISTTSIPFVSTSKDVPSTTPELTSPHKKTTETEFYTATDSFESTIGTTSPTITQTSSVITTQRGDTESISTSIPFESSTKEVPSTTPELTPSHKRTTETDSISTSVPVVSTTKEVTSTTPELTSPHKKTTETAKHVHTATTIPNLARDEEITETDSISTSVPVVSTTKEVTSTTPELTSPHKKTTETAKQVHTTTTIPTLAPDEEITGSAAVEETTLVHTTSNLCPDGKWTTWFNTNDPNAIGDYELVGMIQAIYDVCMDPVSIDCRVVGSASSYDQTSGQGRITCEPDVGLLCFNEHQQSKQCPDYEVRFFCPCELSTTTATPELTEEVRQTTKADSTTISLSTPAESWTKTSLKQTTKADVTTILQSTEGEQETIPAELESTTLGKQSTKADVTTIRQSTSTAIIHEGTTLDQASSNLCPDGKWTNWFNTNNPDSMGDYESHGMIRATYDVCINPVSIECRAVGSESPYDQTSGQGRITCEPNVGLLCFNEHQQSKQCPDYEVRFFCPCVTITAPPEVTTVGKQTTKPELTTILQSNEFDSLRPTSSTGMSDVVETKSVSPSVGSTTEDLQSTIRKITIPGVLFELF
uniref:Mucin-5AC-like n=1 Tax=Saccoglossus kowalevskii TaxID=10224 RepID=A0ABM0MUX9_SACKO|nr:PREDICTED: mucin-5AC-like [Saccoglossus kowalevskii]